MNFRIAAAEPNHLARWQLAIAQRAEAHDIHSAAFKQREVIRVVKVEGLVVGQRQRQARASIRRRQRRPLPGGQDGELAEGKKLFNIQRLRQRLGKIAPRLLVNQRLAGGNQPQMAFG